MKRFNPNHLQISGYAYANPVIARRFAPVFNGLGKG
jgi:hypothetical protein